jgi:DNA-binding transcriptional LysR family regulator
MIYQTLLRLVEAGLGISIEPLSAVKNASNKVQIIELTELQFKSELSLVWKKENQNQKINTIIDKLLSTINSKNF